MIPSPQPGKYLLLLDDSWSMLSLPPEPLRLGGLLSDPLHVNAGNVLHFPTHPDREFSATWTVWRALRTRAAVWYPTVHLSLPEIGIMGTRRFVRAARRSLSTYF